MIDTSAERKKEEGAKPQFRLTGFTQAAGIRIYAFEGRVDARRFDYTIEVDLALIPGYGIRIQDLPLLCREFLEQRVILDEISEFVFTEQRMRSHAERLAIARDATEHRKKQPKHLANAEPQIAWRPALR